MLAPFVMNTLGLLGLATVALGACSSSVDAVGTTAVTSASFVPSEEAVERVATERCRRELSCDEIGPDRTWLGMDDCLHDVRREMRDYLRSQSCYQGIDAYGLAACVDGIRNARCDEEGAGVPRRAECRAVKLCR
jgi:hypothetical protein